MKQTLITLLIFTLFTDVYAKAPVWKITKTHEKQSAESAGRTSDTLYIGGTLHVLSQADYPLPTAFDTAYMTADELIFETNIEELSTAESQAKLLAVMMFQDKKNLKSVLSHDVYIELEKFMRERQLPIANFAKFTPAGLSITLTVIELQRLGLMNTVGVDAYYSLRGKNEGKQLGELESTEEQIQFIANLNNEDSDQLVLSTIRDTDRLSLLWQDLLTAWRKGDSAKLEELAITPMIEEFPETYKQLLVERNNNWLQKIHTMLTTKDIEFLLVGSLHLVGDDGLIEQLKSNGYQVEQLD